MKILQAKEYLGLHLQRTVSIEDGYARVHHADAYKLQDVLYRAAITVTPKDTDLSLVPLPDNNSCIVSIGATHPQWNTLLQEKCPNTKRISLPHNHTEQQAEQVFDDIHDTPTVIVTIHSTNKFAHQHFGIAPQTVALIHKLQTMGKKVILVLFANPYSNTLFPPTDICIYAYEDTLWSQRAIVDVLLGKTPAIGSLPITLRD